MIHAGRRSLQINVRGWIIYVEFYFSPATSDEAAEFDILHEKVLWSGAGAKPDEQEVINEIARELSIDD